MALERLSPRHRLRRRPKELRQERYDRFKILPVHCQALFVEKGIPHRLPCLDEFGGQGRRQFGREGRAPAPEGGSNGLGERRASWARS